MRNFLAFIRRFQVLLFFALLQGIALTIYFTFSVFPRSQYLTTASSISGSILSVRNDLTKHFNLSASNRKLQAENSLLRKELTQNQLTIDQTWELDSSKAKNDSTIQQFEYIGGMIINSTFNRVNNYFTLNIGKKQGVEAGMGVISDKGVVGVIHNSSEHFSVVKSCLTSNINMDIMIEYSGEPGLLKWNGKDARRGNMTGVSNDTEIKPWSKVVTRGGAKKFPRGIPVGKVAKTEVVEGQPLWDVTILYAENFRSVQYVYVIKNLLLNEQQELESQIPNDIEN
ncbi:MAG: rod shape-determining protein MreC [Crocinitomicaceae bacterium]|nr:rod shape-determining protein MreC [Crocinitomicaceae bacterium]